MPFDFKKEEKQFYKPKTKPGLIDVPKMKFIAVRGTGDPNEEGGAYKESVTLLYPIAYKLKMSYKGEYKIKGFYEYVVPPLEGFWWQEGLAGVDLSKMETFSWISIIRVPDFITKQDFDWAIEETTKKKQLDFSKVEFITIDEGLCVQMMHIGPFNTEKETVEKMHKYIEDNGFQLDFNDYRKHHEIYLSDIRKVDSAKWKTVIRHPIIKK